MCFDAIAKFLLEFISSVVILDLIAHNARSNLACPAPPQKLHSSSQSSCFHANKKVNLHRQDACSRQNVVRFSSLLFPAFLAILDHHFRLTGAVCH